MKSAVKSIISLFAICAIIAVVLAFTNQFTSAVIKKNEEAAVKQSLLEVLPEGKEFKEIEALPSWVDESITEIFEESEGGYVFKINAKGYNPNMIIMCGIGNDGKVKGAKCLSSSETLGYEKTYGADFAGKDTNTVNDVATKSGATKTTAGYKNAIKLALEAFERLSNGGNVQ